MNIFTISKEEDIDQVMRVIRQGSIGAFEIDKSLDETERLKLMCAANEKYAKLYKNVVFKSARVK